MTRRSILFFFNDTATTEIYTLSLHDALPICKIKAVTAIRNLSLITVAGRGMLGVPGIAARTFTTVARLHASVLMISQADRKSTRLNSSHANISYAVFCLKKKDENSSSTIST